MTVHVACVVEGHGEVAALPILLRRIHQAVAPSTPLHVARPVRVPKTKLVRPDGLERAVRLAARLCPRPCALLALLDADDDCPAVLGPQLLARAEAVLRDIPTGVVLANREFEAWFLAGLSSLGGKRGLPQDVSHVDQPESIRDAKGFLGGLMDSPRSYSPTADQPAFTATFDMNAARATSDSFDKCCREVERLLRSPGKSLPSG